MDSGSKKPSHSISNASQTCLNLFQSCRSQNPDAFAELEAAERRFRAWTNNLKVFSQGASLDTQLRAERYGQIRQMVMLLLNVLNENLSLALKFVSPGQIKPSDQPLLEVPLFGIDGSLKRLEKVAAVILQATQGSLIKRTIVFAEKHDDFQKLSRTFSMVILSRYRGLGPKDRPENMPLEISEDLIPTKDKLLAPRPDGLFLALVKTSIVRHFRILYERDRRDRENRGLAAPAMETPTPQVSNPAEGDTIPRQFNLSQSNKLASGEANQTAERGDEAQSEKQPTVLSIDVDGFNTGIARTDSGSTSAHGKSASPVSETGVASYPRAPKIPDGQKEGTCPICKQVLPAEELKGANWIIHATKDIKPYVCIFGDCMSNIQFFERRRHWINHMHKVHTPLWIRYLHNPLRWNCSLCHSASAAVFISKEETEASFIEHLQQSHPHTENREWQHLVSSSMVPQPRSSEYCPICGTLHQPRAIPQPEHQSEVTKGNTRAGTQGSGAWATKDASKSQRKPKVGFATLEASDGEDRKRSAENSSPKPSTWRSTRATDDHGVENCIAEHLRALALNFSTRLIDDGQRDSDVPSGRSSDSDWFELEDLPEVSSEDESPRLPSGKCDEIDRFPIPDKEKVEMKKCIAKNLQDLRMKSDEQINWNFSWLDGYRVIEPNISDEERERSFPDDCRRGNDIIWSGMDPKCVPAYVACLFMIVELCRRVLLSSEMEGNDNKSSVQECLNHAEAFSKVRQAIFSNLDPEDKVQKSRFVSAVEQGAKDAEDIRAQLSSTSGASTMPDTVRAAITKKLLETERRLYFHLGLADVDGCINDILKVDTTVVFDTYLGDPRQHAIEDVLAAIRSGNFELQEVVAAHIDTLVKISPSGAGHVMDMARLSPRDKSKVAELAQKMMNTASEQQQQQQGMTQNPNKPMYFAIPNTGEGALILSFFFHGHGTELQKTPLGLFRSLLHQLLRQASEALEDKNLVATFQQRCETVGKPGEEWQWHPSELPRLLESSLLKVLETHSVWLFVDALDECGKENAVKLVKIFKSLLQGLPSNDLKEFRICFTCRHYPILDLGGVFEVCLEDESRKDIATFVQHELSSFRERISTIPDLITERADGVFLWAMLVVKRVLDLELEGAGLKQIEAVILSVPQELDALYRELIQSMSPDSLKLIQWICFATRPLSLDELRWAMLIDADCLYRSLRECQSAGDYPSDDDGMKRRVQTLSCGLAEVTSDAKVIQFIHQSVKDFFVEKGLSALDESAKTDSVVGIAHHRLSRTCIRYLAMEEIGRSRTERAGIDIDCKNTDGQTPLSQAALGGYETVVRLLINHGAAVKEPDKEGRTALWWATWGGHEAVVQLLVDQGADVKEPDKDRRTPLLQAAWAGNEAVVRLLLEKGGAIDAPDKEGRTPLLQAAWKGHESIVRLLLEKGAAIDAPDKERRTPLSQAAWAGNEAVVRLLLGGGAHTETADKRGRTPLSWAAENGHEAVVRLLLEKGAAIDVPDKEGRTPLSQAAWAGNEAVVRLLLEKGAAIDAPDKEGRTPLSQAAWAGHEAVVRLLLEKDAAINTPDKNRRTPLSQAAWAGHEAVVRLLLEKGAAIDAPDKNRRTPLSQAAWAGNEAVVRLLLEKDAAIDIPDKEGRTPLSQAAWAGNEAVVRLLLENDAAIDALDKEGRTPLLQAAWAGHEAVVRLLLEKDAAIDAPDKEGRTPLLQATGAGHEAVVRLLLEKDAAIDAPDKEGRTPLLQATGAGNEAVVRLLLEKDAAIDAPDKEGQMPLSQATWRGHESVVRLLLEKGADVKESDKEGRTPLLQAAWKGHEAVVRLLLEKGAAIDAPDKEGRTPLSQAAGAGNEAVVRLLLGGGAHTETADKRGRTPLSWAAENGHEAVVRLLLEKGAAIDAPDKEGRTPLSQAAGAGNEAVVRLLLEKDAAIDAPDKNRRTPLSQAAGAGHEAVVRLLLEKDAAIDAPDKERRTPLLQAAWAGNEAVVRLLLEKDAAINTPDKNRRTPLSQAAWAGNEAVVRLLLEKGAAIDAPEKEGRTPLSRAAWAGHEAVVRLLLEKDAAIDAPDKEGRTPLSQAAWAGHEAVVRLLLEKGAAIDAPDKNRRTPLSQAAWAGNEAVVRLLLENDAAIDALDKEGRTPLLQAAWAGHEAVVRLLLEKGAAIDAPDKNRRTPLSQAARAGHESIVRLLLGGGAHTETADKRGRTPLSWAVENGNESVVRLLQVDAAQPSSTPLS
ncbi:hypothetical protein NCS57_00950500 [Fusarium keratoplasticum]|uniref:Uncharacterized protein n=1 Tax=Fusarium keratoplasticum TaxID=1328300 RepID=A0ACC0QTA0_9HYPO|nr:hypothetical protein NCS57_00950500 [Fusarium keratoplasticum]KAI8663493.1 hypothetical protein NCS57_00950500 [Fusarium keratoplasticum]